MEPASAAIMFVFSFLLFNLFHFPVGKFSFVFERAQRLKAIVDKYVTWKIKLTMNKMSPVGTAGSRTPELCFVN